MNNATIANRCNNCYQDVQFILCVRPWHTGTMRGETRKIPTHFVVVCFSLRCIYMQCLGKSFEAEFCWDGDSHVYSNVLVCLAECLCEAWKWLETVPEFACFVCVFTCVYTFLCGYACVWKLEELRNLPGTVCPSIVSLFPTFPVLGL